MIVQVVAIIGIVAAAIATVYFLWRTPRCPACERRLDEFNEVLEDANGDRYCSLSCAMDRVATPPLTKRRIDE